MGLREIKSDLNKMNKLELIKLISELYKNVPSAKEYLDILVTGRVKEVLDKYKLEIEKYIFPYGRNMVLKESKARKKIREIRKLKITELNIEIELHYVTCCLEVVEDYGYYDGDYFYHISSMYNSALQGIELMGIESKYQNRLDEILNRAHKNDIEL